MPKTNTSKYGLVDELLTRDELAKKIKTTGRSIDNYVAKDIIPRIKIGGLSRYNWLDVCEALMNQEGGN